MKTKLKYGFFVFFHFLVFPFVRSSRFSIFLLLLPSSTFHLPVIIFDDLATCWVSLSFTRSIFTLRILCDSEYVIGYIAIHKIFCTSGSVARRITAWYSLTLFSSVYIFSKMMFLRNHSLIRMSVYTRRLCLWVDVAVRCYVSFYYDVRVR